MKIIAIGDIHGSSHWKDIIKNEVFDKVVFVGDYFDSFDHSHEVQIQNFMEIMELKKSRPSDVVLLVGNHDFHYMEFTKDRYSGFQYGNMFLIRNLLSQAMGSNLIQMCYIYDNVIFTHAGVTKTWVKNNNIDLKNLEASINDRFIYKPRSFEFYGWNQYGDDITQSPIWVRPASLTKDRLDGFTFVVGHTASNEMMMSNDIIRIDTLRTSQEYLVVDSVFGESKFEFKKL